MNILQQEDLIKGSPDQALLEEAQNPTGQVPQYLVISEIKRRTDMRKRYEAEEQQPTDTVAEQIMAESMGGSAPPPMAPQGAPMPPQNGMPPQMPPQMPSAPPQMPPAPVSAQMPPEMPPPEMMAAMNGMPPPGMMPPQMMSNGGMIGSIEEAPNAILEDARKFRMDSMENIPVGDMMAMSQAVDMGIPSVLPMSRGGVVKMRDLGSVPGQLPPEIMNLSNEEIQGYLASLGISNIPQDVIAFMESRQSGSISPEENAEIDAEIAGREAQIAESLSQSAIPQAVQDILPISSPTTPPELPKIDTAQSILEEISGAPQRREDLFAGVPGAVEEMGPPVPAEPGASASDRYAELIAQAGPQAHLPQEFPDSYLGFPPDSQPEDILSREQVMGQVSPVGEQAGAGVDDGRDDTLIKAILDQSGTKGQLSTYLKELDELKKRKLTPVDYSQLLEKSQEKAGKTMWSQALIQLGAGIAGGNVSEGLKNAGDALMVLQDKHDTLTQTLELAQLRGASEAEAEELQRLITITAAQLGAIPAPVKVTLTELQKEYQHLHTLESTPGSSPQEIADTKSRIERLAREYDLTELQKNNIRLSQLKDIANPTEAQMEEIRSLEARQSTLEIGSIQDLMVPIFEKVKAGEELSDAEEEAMALYKNLDFVDQWMRAFQVRQFESEQSGGGNRNGGQVEINGTEEQSELVLGDDGVYRPVFQ